MDIYLAIHLPHQVLIPSWEVMASTLFNNMAPYRENQLLEQ